MIVSIDIETTGLDPNVHSVLEIAAVIDNDEKNITDCDVIHCYVIHSEVVGSLVALNMNTEAIRRIIDRQDSFTFITPEQVADYFNFRLPKEKYTVAGANLANFDLRFLRKLDWEPNCFHRIIDVGNLYWDWTIDYDRLPSMQKCLERAGFEGSVKHNAIDDARDVLRLIRKYNENN